MILLFRCGHQSKHVEGREPQCPECGNKGIARVVGAPMPRIVGTASGPYVQTRALDPATPTIGDAPLRLRQEKTDADA